MKLKLATNLVLNWVCPVLSFPESLQPIITTAMCTELINVLEPSALNAKSQYFIAIFNKISWFCGQQPGGDEAANEGCNSGPTGHDFMDNSNVLLNTACMVMLEKWAIAKKNACPRQS
jgi:hypothetical protein